jgi:hypothetical protein
MKTTQYRSSQNSILRMAMTATAVISLGTSAASAGTTSSGKSPAPVAPAPEVPFVTGNLTVNYNSHFISYGQDIWAAGNSWEDALVNPSLELAFNLGGGWQFYVNTWWDINDNAPTTIGKYIQEVDVGAGFYYTMDKFKFQLGYGSWNYAEQTEHVIDAKVSYSDGLFNPFVLLHGRPAIGSNIPLDTGLVGQIGIAPGKTFGAVSLSLPITVSFDTDGFHGGDGGFAYVSAGPSASIALSKHISMNLAVTYYHTQSGVFPTNPDSDFVTGTAGFTVAF